MTMTNAQAALQAAARVHAGSTRRFDDRSILTQADRFKAWLDQQEEDGQAEAERDTALDSLVERAGLTREPELHADYRGESIDADDRLAAMVQRINAQPLGFSRGPRRYGRDG